MFNQPIKCAFKFITVSNLPIIFSSGSLVKFTNVRGDEEIIAGSFQSQFIDYFRGHIVFGTSLCSFMLIRTK